MLGCVLVTLSALFCMLQPPAAEPIDLAAAKAAFGLAERLWQADNGKLWGISLRGPMIFADPRSRQVVANSPDQEGHLKPEDGLYVGKLPPGIPIANFSVKWAGVTWIMLVWPLPSDSRYQAILLMHEPFHRIQAQIGLPATNPANHHLDTAEGRYWLQLEWRALRAALLAQEDPKRLDALRDALLFRTIRRALFPEARVEERSLEMHEGLANYTGLALSGLTRDQQRAYWAEQLNEPNKSYPSFTRSFAYLSGPAYGLLLDLKDIPWRKGLNPSQDFTALIQTAYGLSEPEPSKTKAEERAKDYGSVTLHQVESDRERSRQERISRYRKQFVDDPVLVLPMMKAQRQFNPNNLIPLEKLGTVYPTLNVIDVWGSITVKDGALLSPDFKTLTLSAPTDPHSQPPSGPGWQLELKANWQLQPGSRTGDWKIVEMK
jgi:hypothetical protein